MATTTAERKRMQRARARAAGVVPVTLDVPACLSDAFRRLAQAARTAPDPSTMPLHLAASVSADQAEAARAAINDKAAGLLSLFVRIVESGDERTLNRLAERLRLTEDMLKHQ